MNSKRFMKNEYCKWNIDLFSDIYKLKLFILQHISVFHLPIILNPSESLLWFVAQPSNLFFPKCKGELLNFLLLVKLTIFYDLFLSGLTLFPFYPCLCVWVKVGLTFRFPWDLLLETEEVYVKVVWYNLSW